LREDAPRFGEAVAASVDFCLTSAYQNEKSGRSDPRPLPGQERTSNIGCLESGFDPSATLAVHCGNSFSARFSPIKVLD
jgi:hypothetical protein